MATQQTLKLSDRAPKKPIRNLPPTLDYDVNATVEDIKIQIAKATGVKDFNRIGLYDPSTKKTLKNRKARIVEEPAVLLAGEVQVKDLGPQIAWRTVFLVEYFGPILFHVLIVALRPYLYKDGDSPMSTTQWLTFAMVILHFVKRELETLFVHKFSANTMPASNIFKNSFFYWAASGLLCAYVSYNPHSITGRADQPLVDAAGVLVYLFGEIMNALVHLYLASLRSVGGTERKIPVGYGFELVTCPNYLYEILSWVGIIIVSRSWSYAFFISMGIYQMLDWAKGKERAYRKEFGDRYKKKRYTIVPGLF